jgi:hypothetical protein
MGWGGTCPWEDEHRDRYLEDQISLNGRWDTAILLRTNEEEIEKKKAKGSRRAEMEWAHLKRKHRSVDRSLPQKAAEDLVQLGDPNPENRSLGKPTSTTSDSAQAEFWATQDREGGSVGKSLSIIGGSYL